MNAALILLVLAANEPVVETPVELEGWHFAGVPAFSYGSDVGLSLGAEIFLYKPLRGHPDERDEFTIGISYATRGPRAVDAGGSARRLFGTSLRTGLNVHVGDDPLSPYWGEGAQLGGLSVPPGFGSPPEPYRYHDRRIFAAATLRGAIAGPLGWHVRARYLNVGVREQSALLASSDPPGAHGGRVTLGELGLLFDSRDREIGTHSGVFATAAAFVAPQINGVSDFAFHGYDAAIRFYVPLWSGGTLAARALYDRKIAGIPSVQSATSAVPFFERTLYEGIAYNEGLGGAGTIRGIARYRLEGEEKLLGNVQLRVNLFSSHLFDKTQEYGISAGLDAGRAQQKGFDAVDAAGVAIGLRLIWDHAILFRIEGGRAVGHVQGAENTLYLSFGEQF